VETGEQYHLEFTEKEERERDAEEAQWKADAPKRAAEQAEQQRKAKEFRESLAYEERVVAFMDILGWRNAIVRSAEDAELTRELGLSLSIAANAGRHAERLAAMGADGKWPGDPQVTHFSDSVLVSVIADRNAEENLTHFLRAIVWTLVRRGMFVRGGVAFGQLIHRSGLAYGPALNAAYDLEHDVAVYPRIILDDALAARWGSGVTVSDRNGREIGKRREWREDADRRYFFDFLKPIPVIPGTDHGEKFWRSSLEPIRDTITKSLAKYSDPHIKKKYQWAANYFNAFRKEHAPFIEPLGPA
jgi:hypothetical protein